jgi:hypothetical protein
MADCGINGGMCKEPARPYDGKIPLEVLVEREKVRPQQGTGDLWQAAEAGLQFFRMLDTANLSRLRPAYLHQYALAPGADASSQPISAVVSGRVVDGIKLHADLARAGTALPAQPALCDADRTAVLPVAKAWRACYESLFSEPVGGDSWSPDRMEYGFALGSTSGSTQCVAAPAATTHRALAAPVTFRGMPARRFWELEDAAVDIGALSATAEDIGRLLLREFALIYGNDWFQIPLSVPVGSGVTVNSLTVTDTLGVTTPIPHYVDADGTTGGWRVFALSADRSGFCARVGRDTRGGGADRRRHNRGCADATRRAGQHGMGRGANGSRTLRVARGSRFGMEDRGASSEAFGGWRFA